MLYYFNKMGTFTSIANRSKTASNRQHKRHQLVKYKGKAMRAIEYCRLVAKDLPALRFADGKPVDHLEQIMIFFKKDGLKGVYAYIRHVQKVCNREYARYKRVKRWNQFLNFFGLGVKVATT